LYIGLFRPRQDRADARCDRGGYQSGRPAEICWRIALRENRGAPIDVLRSPIS